MLPNGPLSLVSSTPGVSDVHKVILEYAWWCSWYSDAP